MRKVVAVVAAVGVTCVTAGARSATLEADYLFNNTLTSSVTGAPTLTAVDPLALSGFVTTNVFGSSRTVYNFEGAASPPSSQGGLQLSTPTLLSDPTSYSVNMVVDLFGATGWRRLLDVQNRASDNGFYVDPNSNLDLFRVAGSSAGFTNNTFHDVTLTVGGGTVTAYLDGVSQITATSSLMNLNIDTTDNPNALLGVFLDNTQGGGQGEWSAGDIAQLSIYDGVLTQTDINGIDADPFAAPGSTPSVPEPGSLLLLAGGLAGLAAARRRR